MQRILIAEDEDAIREAQTAYLRHADYEVIEARDGAAALEAFDATAPHLVVLDLSLPKLDGLEVCRSLRRHSHVPVLMVTARTSDIDELLGLEVGADDYLKKPFNPRIMVARVGALLRRAGTRPLVVGPFRVDPDKLMVTKQDRLVALTTTQFNIFYRLAAHPGVVLTRTQLLDAAHDNHGGFRDVFDRTIDAHIKAIRKCIEDDSTKPRYIQTVIGRGYRFVEHPDA